MTIVARRGRIHAEARPRRVSFGRPPAGAIDQGGSADHRELARLALDVAVRTDEPVDLPRRWTTWPFGQEVDRTRAQLGPIRSRSALAASYSREASIAVSRGAVESGMAAGPVRVAYAIRWLELGDGRARRAWSAVTAGPVDLVAAAIAATGRSGADQRKGEITT